MIIPALLALAVSVSAETCHVVGISDGDTMKVVCGSVEKKIRLAHIDTPEKAQPFGTQAKKRASELAFGKDVNIVAKDIDRYGRTVAEVFLIDGKCVNRELVKSGYAWHYAAYSKDNTYAQLEMEARRKKRGLWSDPKPIQPWKFRKDKRKRRTFPDGGV